MQYNNSVWAHYQKDWVDPMYVPYLRKKDGNRMVYVHPPSNDCVDPLLIRKDRGWEFQPQFSSYGCPDRWTKQGDYCVQSPHVPTTMYIAKHLDFLTKKVDVKSESSIRNISFDPMTGKRIEYIMGKREANDKTSMALDY